MKEYQPHGTEGDAGGPLDAGLPPESLIRRRTAAEALQQPTTVLPLAVCVASGVYLVLLSPLLGGAGGALALTGLSGAVATVSFVSHYRLAYPRNARAVVTALRDERTRLDRAELIQWCETLRSGFLSLNCGEGLRVLTGLTASYESLRPTLDRHRLTDPLSVSLLPALAGETYRRGLGVLADALELMNAVPIPDETAVGQGSPSLQERIDTTEDRGLWEETTRFREEQLASTRQQREMLLRLRLHSEHLLHEAQRCQAALYTTQIEMASARANGPRTSVDSAISALQATIQQMKEVQDEFDKLGRRQISENEVEGGFDDIG